MDVVEAKACARILFAVACADGKIDPEERRLLEVCGADVHDGPVDVEAELRKLVSDTAKERALHAAIAIADLDGHCTPKELALLELIHARLGSPKKLPLATLHKETRAEIREVRAALEEATVEFLHAVGSRHDELSQKAYEALAADLDKKKREILGRAVVIQSKPPSA